MNDFVGGLNHEFDSKKPELTAIAFAEWIRENQYTVSHRGDKWWCMNPSERNDIYYTEEELWIEYTKTLKV